MALPPFNPSGQQTQQAQPTDRKKTGTGFTNLNRVLSANEGNRLGQAVGGGVSNQATQAKDAIGRAQSAFQQQSEANRLDTEENKQKRAQGIQNAGQQQGEQPVQTQQMVDDFSRFRQGQYVGPQGIENEGQVINQAQQAQNLGQMVGTQGGRQALLQRFVGGEGYSQGKQRLDSLLLGQSGQQELRDARRDTQGLANQALQTADAATQRAQYLSNQAKAFGDETRSQLADAFSRVQSDVDARVGQYNQLRAEDMERLNRLRSDLAFDPNRQQIQLSQDDYDFLVRSGFNPADQRALNLDLNNFFSQGMEGTRAELADQQQAARARDLAALYGQDISEGEKAFSSDLENAGDALGSLIGKQAVNFKTDDFTTARDAEMQKQIDRLLGAANQNSGILNNDYLKTMYGSDLNRALQAATQTDKTGSELYDAITQGGFFDQEAMRERLLSSVDNSRLKGALDPETLKQNRIKEAQSKLGSATSDQERVMLNLYIRSQQGDQQAQNLLKGYMGESAAGSRTIEAINKTTDPRAQLQNPLNAWLTDLQNKTKDSQLGSLRQFMVAPQQEG